MSYTVTVTGQGQISIPAYLRRKYNLNQSGATIVLHDAGGHIVMSPVPDLLSLGGSLKTKKRFTVKQEKEAFAKYFAEAAAR